VAELEELPPEALDIRVEEFTGKYPIRIAVKEERLRDGRRRRRHQFQMYRGLIGHGRHRVDRLLCQIDQGTSADLQRRASRLHALKIEDVVDQPNQPIGIRNRDTQQVLSFGIKVPHDAGGEQT
jgi:hypothetical protein